MNVSIIVPVLNEAATVPELLHGLSEAGAWQTIVVDGGSSDGTWEKLNAGRPAPDILCRAPRGRALQMNSGARRASGDLLLFLHADTRLPDGALARAVEGLRRAPESRWGRFDVRFDHAGPTLKLVAAAMNRRSAWTSICTGDQAIFIRREEFLDIGGFAALPLMEDIDLSRRLKRRSRPLRIREPVTTSARRWREHGVWRTIFLMWRLRWMFWRGVPASNLAARYRTRR